MRTRLLHLPVPLGLAAAITLTPAALAAERWLTNPDGAERFEKQPVPTATQASLGPDRLCIRIDSARRYQPIDGFGYTLTGGSAMLLMRMTPSARSDLLRELFTTNAAHIGVSYLRVSIGASDLNPQAYSYDDLPQGQTDPDLKHFSLGPDRADVVPVLKEILALQPDIGIMGSPWSAPVWMKTNGDFRGGSLKPEWYAVYARYLVRYVQEMAAAGIPLHAITVQNEPLHAGNNPSMYMDAAAQTTFIRDHLGPAFRAAHLTTRIVCYDHNADRPDYPLSVLEDQQARAFVDGSAFHLYAGRIDALSQVHEAHPDKNLYFTEQWIGAPGNLRNNLRWHISQLMVGATRNWCRTVLEWNLAADPQHDPHTDRGGCDRCLGAVTLDGDQVTRNPAYYIIAHASKFVRPGSIRISSTAPDDLPNVAFSTPSGQTVVIVLNPTRTPMTFDLQDGTQAFSTTLSAGAAATYVW